MSTVKFSLMPLMPFASAKRFSPRALAHRRSFLYTRELPYKETSIAPIGGAKSAG